MKVPSRSIYESIRGNKELAPNSDPLDITNIEKVDVDTRPLLTVRRKS